MPHLTPEEVHALLDVPDVSVRMGIRDRAMMHVAYAAGLRVSELVNLRRNAVSTYPHAALRILGKGRKERSLPLWRQAAKDLKAWLAVRGEIAGVDEVFVNRCGTPLTRSGFAYILQKHARVAASRCAGSLESSQLSGLLSDADQDVRWSACGCAVAAQQKSPLEGRFLLLCVPASRGAWTADEEVCLRHLCV